MKFWELFARLLTYVLGRVKIIQDGEYSIILVKRLVPKWAAGQTWGRVIILKSGLETNRGLIEHEKVHTEQWHNLGFWFPFVYGWLMILSAKKHGVRLAYHNHPFETEARHKSGH